LSARNGIFGCGDRATEIAARENGRPKKPIGAETIRPERPERRLRLVSAIARGRRWLDEIISGSVTDVEQIALCERCSVRHVNMTNSLAFLAPKLVRAAVEGRLPLGINIERLRDAPAAGSSKRLG
jgi:site-specific DNA recombinase